MTDERITAYLLEELPEKESEQFEEQCFAQEEWPAAEFDAAEQDLIDAYLRNELGSDRKRRFEERYLTTDTRKARVLAAKTMHQVLCPLPKITFREKLQAFWQRRLVPQAAVAVLVLAVGIVGIVGLRISGPRTPQTFTQIELAMSTSNRSSGPQLRIVELPLSSSALRIHLKLPEPAPDTAGYSVQWEKTNGQSIKLQIDSRDAQSVVVIIPADQLEPGQHLLRLFNKNELIGNYFFKAEPRNR